MTTFGELKAAVLFNVFDVKYDAEAGRRINAAAREVAGRVRWNETLRPGTVGADGLVTFADPVEFVKVTQVWRVAPSWTPTPDAWSTIRDSLAERIPPAGQTGLLGHDRWMVAYLLDTTTAGAQRVRIVGLQPGDTVAVQGPQIPARLDADADLSPLGDDADDLLVLYARAKLYLREDDPEMHGALLTEFERSLKTYAQRAAPQVEGPVQIGGMWDGVL